MTTDGSEGSVSTLRDQNHPYCVVCGQSNGHGLGLDVRVTAPGVVEAMFHCNSQFEGYPGMLHGGMTCALLDGAMTNCLFAHECVAVTVELNVRFRNPVAVGRTVAIKAWIESSLPPLYVLAGEIRQDGELMATATGKFMEKSMMSVWTARNRP